MALTFPVQNYFCSSELKINLPLLGGTYSSSLSITSIRAIIFKNVFTFN
jgi:hypothetical protein